MTEKEIKKVHSKDRVSARSNTTLGEIRKIKGLGYSKLVHKRVWRINICPHCGSLSTFHRDVNDPANPNRNAIDNVYRMFSFKTKTTSFLHKLDYCYRCHKEFSIEMYGWLKLNKEELKKYKNKQSENFWNDFWGKVNDSSDLKPINIYGDYF